MSALQLASRDAEGNVSVLAKDGHTIVAKVPKDRSMIGMIGINGIINGGVYRDDGWVWIAGKPVSKWHVKFDGIRLWEPKFERLTYLYDLWKRTSSKSKEAWEKTNSIMQSIRKGKGPFIAHAKPIHHMNLPGNKSHFGEKDVWWEFEIHDFYGNGLSIGFKWLEEKPKHLIHPKKGEELYKLDIRRDTLSKRCWKARVIFYEAMRQSLPKATENKILTLQFGEDHFVFHSVSPRPDCCYWEMFDDRCSLETIKIV